MENMNDSLQNLESESYQAINQPQEFFFQIQNDQFNHYFSEKKWEEFDQMKSDLNDTKIEKNKNFSQTFDVASQQTSQDLIKNQYLLPSLEIKKQEQKLGKNSEQIYQPHQQQDLDSIKINKSFHSSELKSQELLHDFQKTTAYFQINYLNSDQTWMHTAESIDKSVFERYLESFFVATSSMITVLIYVPQTNTELFVFSLLMFISCGIFGYSINTLGIIMQKINQKQIDVENDIELLNSYMQMYCPGEFIYKQNDEKNLDLYIILKGQVELLTNVNSQVENQNQIEKLQSNQYFGIYSFFTGQKRLTTARSIGFATILKISREKFINLIKNEFQTTDFETFCFIKDRLIYQCDYSLIGLRCVYCNSKYHLAPICQKTHFQNLLQPSDKNLIKNYVQDGRSTSQLPAKKIK
ncbi:Cyclic nucleotide-binding protein [Pseudocohnilembus persalinus]|uniref:Cyclic nucleotide-binding protein n=1 Tax=Pseudocohnilembus persalinus TaxID=266149 RepID=A0A0V0Q9K7_PSEPJ|nr:Cyclic nucleotide-binding protein [Pseudocohnilembus persalinus]|eukprot:KRW98902.1 Cyclic nucleotide-binding protein [Pseudocohnilembus persalinus]